MRKCVVCGLPLSDPNSVMREMGPICARKTGADGAGQLPGIADQYLDAPLTKGLVCRLIDEDAFTNVPHFVVHHSPTGFAWGYPGSGPADLALNLSHWLLWHIGYDGPRMDGHEGSCFRKALEMHQEVKQRFIASLPQAGGEVPGDVLTSFARAWLAEHPQEPYGVRREQRRKARRRERRSRRRDRSSTSL